MASRLDQLVSLVFVLLPICAQAAGISYQKKGSWEDTMLAARAMLAAGNLPEAQRATQARELWARINADFPVQCDWVRQDFGADLSSWLGGATDYQIRQNLVERTGTNPGLEHPALAREWEQVRAAPAGQWLTRYAQLCEQRRTLRLKTLREKAPRFFFTKHRTIQPSFFAYTEGQSDAQAERHFHPGASLCQFELDGLYGKITTLVNDPKGVIRNPEVSHDGKRMLFAWKKSLNEDDYHLYELELASGKIRQITFGLGFADYEPAYLPNGDIVFSMPIRLTPKTTTGSVLPYECAFGISQNVAGNAAHVP